MNTTHFSITLVLFCSFLLCSVAQEPAPVLDIARNVLRGGVNYYVLPVVRGQGGGLTLASRRNRTCPLDVVQDPQEVQNGLPLSFRPVNSTRGVVRVSTDLNIRFSASSSCAQSTVWMLDQGDSTSPFFVTTGGVQGNPGRRTVSSWFKIEEYGSDYKFLFCPTVCDTCRVICREVGIFLQDGRRHLALSDVPFRVMFRKA